MIAGAFALVSAMALPAQAPSDVIAHGKKLYTEANCTQCHGAEMYTRKDRKVNQLSSLRKL